MSAPAALLIGPVIVLLVAIVVLNARGLVRVGRERQAGDGDARRPATIVQQSDDVVILESLDGVIVEWNPGAERLYGYSGEEAVGRPISILIPPERQGEERQLMARAIVGETSGVETMRVRKDGTVVEVSLAVSPIRDVAGDVIAVSRVARDITERKQAEARVLEAERRFRGLLESAPDAMVIASEHGQIALVNEQAEDMFGYSRQEMIGQPVEMLVPEGLRARHAAHRSEFVVEPHARPMGAGLDLVARRKDGSEFPVEISLSPMRTEEELLVSSAIRDVSERKRVEREREQTLEQLQEAQRLARLGAWSWDPHKDQATWSPETYRMFARDPQAGAATGDALLAYVHPEDRERLKAGEVFGDRRAFEFEFRIVGGDGIERILHALGREDADHPGCYIGTVQDVTESRAAQLALRAAEERFHRAFDVAPIGMALVGLDGRIEQANTALGVICERTRNELEGLPLRELVHPADREQSRAVLKALARGRVEDTTLELRFVPAAGSAVDASAYCAVLKDSAGRPDRVLCQFLDVTERKRFEAQLEFMADHDPLTGLANRRKFEEELDRHVAQVKRYGAEGALLVLDIDHFKQVNDTLGHNVGDELIVSIAGVLRERLRDSDVLARLGGDEFAVLLPKADEAEAAQVARALVLAVRSSAALLGGERKKVTTSAGVALLDGDIEELSAETILIEADLAMYDAKEAGRDRYAFYAASEYRVSRTEARLTWANRIERALENDRFALVAQPILDLRSGRVNQHELLIRMLDDRDDQIPPATFLYIAERFGLIGRLDEWVTTRAIELIEQRPDLQLEVNISGRSLGDQRLLQAIDNRLHSAQIDPTQLIFEVTETAAVANITQAQMFAQHLRDLGCRFALDDFGAGFGSFYYLKHLPFDYVKIDGEFVQHAVSGRIDQLVIQAIVDIAQGLGKETIAEFVTNEKTRRMVKRLGVDYAQGNHIGEPVPVTELLALAPPRREGAPGAKLSA